MFRKQAVAWRACARAALIGSPPLVAPVHKKCKTCCNADVTDCAFRIVMTCCSYTLMRHVKLSYFGRISSALSSSTSRPTCPSDRAIHRALTCPFERSPELTTRGCASAKAAAVGAHHATRRSQWRGVPSRPDPCRPDASSAIARSHHEIRFSFSFRCLSRAVAWSCDTWRTREYITRVEVKSSTPSPLLSFPRLRFVRRQRANRGAPPAPGRQSRAQ